jgi:alpha-tubulin suppressor-like RCC1 family protein
MADATAAASSSRGGGETTRRVLFVSAGASHTVALLSGDLVCSWGRGEDGQLGHGDAEERHRPTIVNAHKNNDISSITCGADHTTAYSNSTKTVYSWGW